MAVRTTYDDIRYSLKESLQVCLDKAEVLLTGKDVQGYDDMRRGYAADVYQAVLKALETV